MFINSIFNSKKSAQYAVDIVSAETGEILRTLGDAVYGGYSEQVAKEIAAEYQKAGYLVRVLEIK